MITDIKTKSIVFRTIYRKFELLIFDYLFHKKIGIDHDKNYVYLVSDKYRQQRTIKFINITEPNLLQPTIINFIINCNSIQCKFVQPAIDFVVSRDCKIIMLTMPVVEKSLYSVIKDTSINLKARWDLVKNITDGVMYIHNRRKIKVGCIRPQTIAIHPASNTNLQPKKTSNNSEAPTIYACINLFLLLTQTNQKAEKMKWSQQINYYDAPEVWNEIHKKKKEIPQPITYNQNQISFNFNPSPEAQAKQEKNMIERQQSQIWSLALVLVELLTGKRIYELLQQKNNGKQTDVGPGRILREIKVKQKILKKQADSPEKLAQIEKLDKAERDFYEKLLKQIDSLPLRSLLQKMLSYRGKSRPIIKQVYRLIDKLQVVERNNENLAKITALKRSLRILRDCKEQPANKNELKEDDIIEFIPRQDAEKLDQIGLINEGDKNQEDPKLMNIMQDLQQKEDLQKQIEEVSKLPSKVFKVEESDNQDDKKSVVSRLSIKSSKSIKSHYSQTRKKTPMNFTKLLYTRHQICQIQAKPSNAMYRSYFDDCKNRLIIDQNFAAPPIRIPLTKYDKIITSKVKGETQQDMIKWDVERAIAPKNPDNCLYPQYYDPRRGKQEMNWQMNQKQEEHKQIDIQSESNYGPLVKRIPHEPSKGYNDNLSNYHYLSLKQITHTKALLTSLFRPSSSLATQSESLQKPSQFTINLSYTNLTSIPLNISKLLAPPNCLKYLNITNNQIVSIKSLLMDNQALSYLTVLDLSYNYLQNIDGKLWLFQILEEVYLTGNRLVIISGFSENDEGENNEEENEQDNGECLNESKEQLFENQNQQSHLKIVCEEGSDNQDLSTHKKYLQQQAQLKQSEGSCLPMQQQKEKQQKPQVCSKTCMNLRRVYLNKNKIESISGIFNLPCLKVISLKDNPLKESLNNISAFDKLKKKYVNVLF